MKFVTTLAAPRVLSANEVIQVPVDELDRKVVAQDFSPISCGDMVLYRAEDGQISPAALVQPAGGGCWLARAARNPRGLVYLGPENIVLRLSRVDADLLDEAA